MRARQANLMIDEILKSCDEVIELSRKDCWAVRMAWREVYCARVKEKTGKWKLPGHEWHVFSYDKAKCKNGARSEELYRREWGHTINK